MKTAKRVLAAIVAMIMIVGTCAVAASAAETLQQKIDAAAPGDTVTLTANTKETVKINKDLTLDLNGYRLTSDYGKSAIQITAGNVTVTNGQVISRFANVSSADMIQTVFDKSPCAIRVTGGSLVCDGVRLVGGMTRVPTTTDYFVPTGSGIQSYNGATVTLKRTSIYGDYGVNNAVRENTAGGVVTVEDAVILAYTKAVKGEYVIADGSDEIIAADRIAGVLNSGIHLEENEQKIVNSALNDRTLIVTKWAETLTDILGEATPTVTVTPGKTTADVEAAVLDYTWENTKGTDCSYMLVPEGVTLANGKVAALDKVPADPELLTDDSQIVYRVEYKMSDEAKPYIESLTKEGEENPLDGVVGWAGNEIQTYYEKYTGKTDNGYVDTYDELIEALGDIMWTIDNVGSTQLPGGNQISTIPEYYVLRAKLYALAGKTAYEASADRKANDGYVPFDAQTYYNLFGTTMPADGIVGTLDRVDALKNEMEAIVGGSFANSDKWGDLADWAYKTAYPELLANSDSILNVVVAQLEDLQATLKTSPYDDIISTLGVSDKLSLLDEGVENAKMLQDYYHRALANGDVSATLATIERHKDEIKPYADKVIDVIENWRTYITPEKFIVDNTYVKTYSERGPLQIIEVPANGNLTVIISGAGSVKFSGGIKVPPYETDETISTEFLNSFTLTADPDEGNEFLFWVLRDGNNGRIVSTEPTFTMATKTDRVVEAVFNEIAKPSVYFVNPTGALAFNTNTFNDDGSAKLSNTKDPYVAGYTFAGWPETTKAALDAASTDYYAGNSAFAVPNAYYGENGAVLKVNPNSTSFIVTPKYTFPSDITVTFVDNGETYEATGKYNYVATITSTIEGDAYWKDQATNEIVCVNKTFPYTLIDNATFYSVEGTCPEDVVTRTIVTKNAGKTILNVERSTKRAFTATGVVYIKNPTGEFDAETDLVLGGEGVRKGTAKYTDLTGTYAPSFNDTYLSGATVYVRPYMEFANGEPYYGDVVTFVNGVQQ